MHYMGFTFGTMTHWDKAAMFAELLDFWTDIVFPIMVTFMIFDFFMYLIFSWVFIGPACTWFVSAFNRADI